MWNKIVIKKEVQTDLRKVLQRFLIQVILNIIQGQNTSRGMDCVENPDGEPKKSFTFLTTYRAILSNKGIQDMIHKVYVGFETDSELSLEDKKYLHEKCIWHELGEILKDESNNLIHAITEVDQGYPNPMILGQPKSILLFIKMDREAVDEWFKIVDQPLIRIIDTNDEP
jgi:hypothetical protein